MKAFRAHREHTEAQHVVQSFFDMKDTHWLLSCHLHDTPGYISSNLQLEQSYLPVRKGNKLQLRL